MICLCGRPMNTYPKVKAITPLIGGYSDSTDYVTWEVKECRHCKRYVLEYYEAKEITLSQISAIKMGGMTFSGLVKLSDD